jgi:hypothetical protein
MQSMYLRYIPSNYHQRLLSCLLLTLQQYPNEINPKVAPEALAQAINCVLRSVVMMRSHAGCICVEEFSC